MDDGPTSSLPKEVAPTIRARRRQPRPHAEPESGAAFTRINYPVWLGEAIAWGGGGERRGLAPPGGCWGGWDGMGVCPTPARHVARPTLCVSGLCHRLPRAGLGATQTTTDPVRDRRVKFPYPHSLGTLVGVTSGASGPHSRTWVWGGGTQWPQRCACGGCGVQHAKWEGNQGSQRGMGRRSRCAHAERWCESAAGTPRLQVQEHQGTWYRACFRGRGDHSKKTTPAVISGRRFSWTTTQCSVGCAADDPLARTTNADPGGGGGLASRGRPTHPHQKHFRQKENEILIKRLAIGGRFLASGLSGRPPGGTVGGRSATKRWPSPPANEPFHSKTPKPFPLLLANLIS